MRLLGSIVATITEHLVAAIEEAYETVETKEKIPGGIVFRAKNQSKKALSQACTQALEKPEGIKTITNNSRRMNSLSIRLLHSSN